MRRWRQDRFVQPAGSDPRQVCRLEARLWELLSDEFVAIDLSPVAPLGTCSALAPIDQNWVISTVRGTEVLSDPTNVLALEAARRRLEDPRSPVHLAACHRVLRGQPFDAPGVFQHFRLFALLSSARDQGSAVTEAALLATHLGFWSSAISSVASGLQVQVAVTGFDFPPLIDRLQDTVLPTLQPLPSTVTVFEDPDRQRARGYYRAGAIRLNIEDEYGEWEIGDGGYTDWTAQLMNDAKERCLISCVATERLAEAADRNRT
jgi:hypothetical protein